MSSAHPGLSPQVYGRLWQQVLNERFPPPAIARALKDVPPAAQIPVWVRIVWSYDGEQVLPGRAARWDRQHVFVYVRDSRLQIGAVWVAPEDVRRQELPGEETEVTP